MKTQKVVSGPSFKGRQSKKALKHFVGSSVKKEKNLPFPQSLFSRVQNASGDFKHSFLLSSLSLALSVSLSLSLSRFRFRFFLVQISLRSSWLELLFRRRDSECFLNRSILSLLYFLCASIFGESLAVFLRDCLYDSIVDNAVWVSISLHCDRDFFLSFLFSF